jgi:hypothetical protein
VSTLRKLVSTPSDAWLLTRIFGWSLVLPIAKRTLPFLRLVRLMRPRTHAAQRDPEREATIVSLAAWVFKTRPPGARDNCLERGLVAYRYLSRVGAGAELVIGVAKGTEGVEGHAWVTVDGRPVHDSSATLANFEPILVVKGDGKLSGTSPSTTTRFDHRHSL